jgi:hypothetical protein
VYVSDIMPERPILEPNMGLGLAMKVASWRTRSRLRRAGRSERNDHELDRGDGC